MKSIIFTCMFVVLSLIQGFPQLDYRTGWQQDSLYGNPSKVLTSIYQLTEKFGEPVEILIVIITPYSCMGPGGIDGTL